MLSTGHIKKGTHLYAMIRTHNFEPNVEFDFDVCVDSIQLLTHTLKLNSTLGTFSGMCPGRNLTCKKWTMNYWTCRQYFVVFGKGSSTHRMPHLE